VLQRDHSYRQIKRQILINELKPDRAFTELAAARELGASQGTIHEALLHLEADSLVLRKGHRGTTVTPLHAEAAGEMLALRRRLETRAAPRAASALTPEARKSIAALLDRMHKAAAGVDEYAVIEHDTAFHVAIFRLAGFRALEQILLRAILHSLRQKLWEPRHRRPLAETAGRHGAILAALDHGGAALSAAIGQHIDTIVDVGVDKVAS
jgi:DNA-binding GntR family transcriptional regulator